MIFIAIFLVLLNALFVAAEFGMVKLRETRIAAIKEKYHFRGKILAAVHKNLDAYLSACQLGITLASLGLGWIGEPAFAHLLEPVFEFFQIRSPELIKLLAFFTAFSFISFLHIVVGELMPKSLAIRRSEQVSLWTALPLYAFYWLMYPAIWLLNHCAFFLLKIFKLDQTHKAELFHSSDEIKLILSASHTHGELRQEEKEILEQTLDFADLKVTDVMRPFEDMVTIKTSQNITDIMQILFDTRFSRYPLLDEKQKKIIGIIHIKDLFAAYYRNPNLESVNFLARPILKIQQQALALELLSQFRSGMTHFALVCNAEQKPIGFITLDNLLHVLVGRIRDEFHKTEEAFIALPDGGFLIDGNESLYTIERALNLDIFTDAEEINTIHGLIFHQLGMLPISGERVDFEQFYLIVDEVKANKIIRVKVYKK